MNGIAGLLPGRDDCCGPPSGSGPARAPWWRSSLGRRTGLLCAAYPAAAMAQISGADYAPLPQPLEFRQVEDAPIWYTIGHPGVPDTANEGNTSNAGFVVTDEGVVVFDTLGTPSLGWALLQKIRAVTDKPIRFVVLSHYHADHIYGLQAFRDHSKAVIVAQAKALDYTAAGNIDDEQAIPRLEQRRAALAPWVNATTRIVEPGFVFRIAAEIRLGGHMLQLTYAGPAHSMSDTMMLVLPDQVLFAGDIVQNGRIPFMASAAVNTDNWLRGLQEVAEMKPRFIIPGHGQPSANASEAIAFTRDYILYVRRAMGEAVSNWTSFDDAYAQADWSPYKDLPAFQASNRGNAYRVFLELENSSFGLAQPSR
ncbi:MAG: MBL fold metallo-hydrolase [Acetobacteraceae bacterium]|nr:MBL fold metallo-hydrolase [Acetobacteraceae bacterium]